MDEDLSFAALANPTRRRLLELLMQGPCTPGELAHEFALSRAAISEHLGILRRAKLVRDTQLGRKRHYELHRESFEELNQWLGKFQRYWEERLEAFGDVLDEDPS